MKAYLRGLADEFGESTNSIRLELNHLEEAGLLRSTIEGNKKVYQANTDHPLFADIRSLVLKHSGITQIIDEVVVRAGDIRKVWVRGNFAEGKDSQLIDLVIACQDLDEDYFTSLVEKASKLVKRKIQYVLISPEEENNYFTDGEKVLLVWRKE